MSHDTTVLHDPNFEGLLREAAAAPNSMLLRVDRPQLLTSLRQREAPVGIAMAGLSSVERELLASYRSELGFLLRQAAVKSMLEDPTGNNWIDRDICDGVRHQPIEHSDLTRECTRLLAHGEPSKDAGVSTVRTLLAEMSHQAGRRIRLLEVASLALRVEPSDQPRVYAATFLATEGQTDAAVRLAHAILDGRGSRLNMVFAAEGAALALGLDRRFEDAYRYMVFANSQRIGRESVPLRCLFYAALGGDRAAITQANSMVEEQVSAGSSGVDEFCEDLQVKLSRGQWRATRACIDSVLAERDHVCAVAGRVLDELAN